MPLPGVPVSDHADKHYVHIDVIFVVSYSSEVYPFLSLLLLVLDQDGLNRFLVLEISDGVQSLL